MDYKVTFSAQSGRDLFAVVSFLAEKNPAAAERLGQALFDTALSLGNFPHRGQAVPARPGVRKLPYPPHHVIFYHIDETSRLVEILRFWDGRKDPESLTLP